ncbi:hypothetical protein ABZX92_32085 [Lentzea sp. NPDC006480]|uniref:hypothetical protein n=1 Tax=Lentzea sp. NPDC006480 TaxID=3157176 RepID=UPI0033B1E83C
MTFRDVVALWLVREKSASDVVLAACDLLVGDVDSPAVARLAAVSTKEADIEVPILLPDALQDLGLAAHVMGSVSAKEEGLRAMAVRVRSGELTPRELTSWAHRIFGHEHAGERLSELDDAYDTCGVSDELDDQVMAEVRRITS